MSTASNPMGLKRICTNCGERFYDLNKRPVVCPDCETEFTGEIKAKTRRGRNAIIEPKKEEKEVKTAANKNDEGEILEEDVGVEVISLDDAEEAAKDEDDDTILSEEDTLDDIPDLGVEVTDDIGDDDTLLDADEE